MSIENFENLVREYINITSERTWMANFEVNSTIISIIWNKIQDKNFKPIHLLWTLHFLRSYDTYEHGCQIWKVTDKTYSYWIWIVIQSLYSTLNEVFIF